MLKAGHAAGCVAGSVPALMVHHNRPAFHTTPALPLSLLIAFLASCQQCSCISSCFWPAWRTGLSSIRRLASSDPASSSYPGNKHVSIALVNQEPFHFEVLAGFMHLAASVSKDMTVYMERHRLGNISDYGFPALVHQHAYAIRDLPVQLEKHSVLVFISPEYNITYVRQAIDEAQPGLVLLVIHNGDTGSLSDLLRVHNNVKLVVLAPHVLNYLLSRPDAAGMGLTQPDAACWMLPILPWRPKNPCPYDALHSCLSGFTIQGKINRFKRNYTHVFEQLGLARQQCRNGMCVKSGDTARLHVQLLGARWTRLMVPSSMRAAVQRKHYLKFRVFYEVIYHTMALLPALGSGGYYDRKISSTLITSLVTGTPMLVDDTLLQVYTGLLNSSHVVTQQPHASLADTMTQMVLSSEAELAAVRRALELLRDHVNADATQKLQHLIKLAGV